MKPGSQHSPEARARIAAATRAAMADRLLRFRATVVSGRPLSLAEQAVIVRKIDDGAFDDEFDAPPGWQLDEADSLLVDCINAQPEPSKLARARTVELKVRRYEGGEGKHDLRKGIEPTDPDRAVLFRIVRWRGGAISTSRLRRLLGVRG